MKKLTRQLEKQRAAIIQQYDEENLHQLRITLRRMRSRLKGTHSHKLRQLRKDLGILAETTNAARDWDTLEIHARNLLNSRHFEHLAPWLQAHQLCAHERVLALLESKKWSDTIAHWKQLAPKTAEKVSGGNMALNPLLPHTLEQVGTARQRALERETERDWHKLRIAIKELRYRLDEQPAARRSRAIRQTLSTCKQLQEELGTWHDTVVHRQLLQSASPEDDALPTILAILDDMLAREGDQCLDRVRALLVEPAVERALSPGLH